MAVLFLIEIQNNTDKDLEMVPVLWAKEVPEYSHKLLMPGAVYKELPIVFNESADCEVICFSCEKNPPQVLVPVRIRDERKPEGDFTIHPSVDPYQTSPAYSESVVEITIDKDTDFIIEKLLAGSSLLVALVLS